MNKQDIVYRLTALQAQMMRWDIYNIRKVQQKNEHEKQVTQL